MLGNPVCFVISMQPNLKSCHAISLEFSTVVPLSVDLISEIRNSSGPDEDGDSLFFDSYRNHRALAIVKGINEESRDKFPVEFTFEARSGGRLPKSMPRTKQLVSILSLLKEQMRFECRVTFVFGRRLKPRPVIPLPIKYIEAPDIPFDRIQGLHLVKTDGSETKYDVFLEAPGRGIIVENVIFRYHSTISESLASNILAEAVSISDKFVSIGAQ